MTAVNDTRSPLSYLDQRLSEDPLLSAVADLFPLPTPRAALVEPGWRRSITRTGRRGPLVANRPPWTSGVGSPPAPASEPFDRTYPDSRDTLSNTASDRTAAGRAGHNSAGHNQAGLRRIGSRIRGTRLTPTVTGGLAAAVLIICALLGLVLHNGVVSLAGIAAAIGLGFACQVTSRRRRPPRRRGGTGHIMDQ